MRQPRGLVRRSELRGLSEDLRAATRSLAAFATSSVPLLRQTRPVASCMNEVLIPWGNDRVGDERFPPSGPVHQEFFKVLPGLAGESRSFDANGSGCGSR